VGEIGGLLAPANLGRDRGTPLKRPGEGLTKDNVSFFGLDEPAIDRLGVTFVDLLGQWGTDPGGPPDLDGDGNVGIVDFLELLASWGPCP